MLFGFHDRCRLSRFPFLAVHQTLSNQSFRKKRTPSAGTKEVSEQQDDEIAAMRNFICVRPFQKFMELSYTYLMQLSRISMHFYVLFFAEAGYKDTWPPKILLSPPSRVRGPPPEKSVLPSFHSGNGSNIKPPSASPIPSDAASVLWPTGRQNVRDLSRLLLQLLIVLGQRRFH